MSGGKITSVICVFVRVLLGHRQTHFLDAILLDFIYTKSYMSGKLRRCSKASVVLSPSLEDNDELASGIVSSFSFMIQTNPQIHQWY